MLVSMLLLASTSPRRAMLLGQAGIAFRTVDPGLSDADEAALAEDAGLLGCDPPAIARRLALAKLLAVLPREEAAPALAADTFLVDGPALLGKPLDRDDARRILSGLRGRAHQVLSGVAVRDAAGRVRLGTCTSQVAFTRFEPATLEAFLDSGQWRGKAGGYGVQDPEAAPLVESVEGSDTNVKGLPMEVVRELLP